ncbi:MAG TPA: ABC transporter permease [Acidimicrobiales bacterium]|nr:ABC transporter permease [Acidimicrobiales bacterium]
MPGSESAAGIIVLESSELPAGAPIGRASSLPAAIMLAVAGAVALLSAGWLITSASTTWRTALALVGVFLLFQGVQRLGRRRFGPGFRLGLWLALFWLALTVLCALFTSFLPVDGYDKVPLGATRLERPAIELDEPLGRDTFGRSNLSRVMYGARTSLAIGAIAVGLGLTVGVTLGLLSGWYGGALDTVVNILANATLAFPPLILLLTIVAVFSRGLLTLALGLAVLSVPTYTRLMRAQTLSYKQREFIAAARSMGATPRRLMFREILPNAILPVLAYSFIVFGVTIVAEASLSYLGLGVPPPRPSWGGMIADGQIKLKTDPHLVYVPAVIMFLTVLSFNRVGEWARAAVLGERTESR